jgi:hypothetical protein
MLTLIESSMTGLYRRVLLVIIDDAAVSSGALHDVPSPPDRAPWIDDGLMVGCLGPTNGGKSLK